MNSLTSVAVETIQSTSSQYSNTFSFGNEGMQIRNTVQHLITLALIWFMVFGLSRCQEQSIPEIKAEIVDISSLDVKDSSAASPDYKAYLNTVSPPAMVPPAMTARPYPLNLNSPLPVPSLAAYTAPMLTQPAREISDTVKFAVTIPPAKKDPLADYYFKTPHRPANPVVIQLEHVTIKTPTRDPYSASSSYGYMKEGEETI
ncbi:hypothetical protein DAPPUDRAFT_331109 [Daphnia pulex]|uniref:Uncharacterized protein n=1 Tax=Daphnia pulex TaxID=6669 RepID=E9HLI3_DAPPU|nr:hypothetical protein DAPPUDRAFT_331109 [Daphnia pulex]|eukprot:EFX67410.1 hypothetical protein DAPPUDRAFT_331109 [Daphnia pulex]